MKEKEMREIIEKVMNDEEKEDESGKPFPIYGISIPIPDEKEETDDDEPFPFSPPLIKYGAPFRGD